MVYRKGSSLEDMGEVSFLGIYHPYWLEYPNHKNPKFDFYSKLILNLKEKNPEAINYFRDLIDQVLEKGIGVAVVPPHTSDNELTGIKILAKEISRYGRTDLTDLLIRGKTIPKQSNGGSRKRELHLESIIVKTEKLKSLDSLIILDDVTTSRQSLMACITLLKQAGIGEVRGLALGHSVKYTEYHSLDNPET